MFSYHKNTGHRLSPLLHPGIYPLFDEIISMLLLYSSFRIKANYCLFLIKKMHDFKTNLHLIKCFIKVILKNKNLMFC